MNLHYRYTRSISETREMERSLLSLFEMYQRLGEDSLNESLSTGRMSDFLFEADEAAVETSVKSARDATSKSLDTLEQVGITLNNSKAIASFVSELRQKLAAVALDSKKSGSLQDFAGFVVKQISFIGDSLSHANKVIDAAVDAMVTSMDSVKIDWKSNENKDLTMGTIVKLWSEKNKDSKVSYDKLEQGIQGIMSKKTGEDAGFFSRIMNMLKGLDVKKVLVPKEQFTKDLLNCEPGHIQEYLKGPGPVQAGGPKPPTANQVQDILDVADVSQQQVANARPPGAPVEKKPIGSQAWRDLAKRDLDRFKDQVNARARELGASIDILENVRSKNNVIVESRWARLAGIEESK